MMKVFCWLMKKKREKVVFSHSPYNNRRSTHSVNAVVQNLTSIIVHIILTRITTNQRLIFKMFHKFTDI